MSSTQNLVVRLSADISDWVNNMNRASESVQKLGDKVKEAGKSIGEKLGGAGLAVGGALALSVDKAAEFEQELSNVKSVMDPSDVQKYGGSLHDLAIKMGAETKYSATEAAQGIEELIKAGVSAKDVMGGGLKGALDLATAGDLSLADASEIASTALNAFHKDSLSVAQAGNILAGAANASATDVGELKFGLSAVAAVASGAGMSFRDTSTALAVFAQNGLKGQDAGTSMKTMLLNLTPSTKSATAAMEKYGIVTKNGSNLFYDAKGNLKSLADISEVLKTHLSGLTNQQREQALMTMFGTDAIRAGNILYDEGAKGVTNMWNAMSKVTAADVAKEKMDNFKGALEQLKGGLETAEIALGETFLPALHQLADFLSGLVDKFNNLSPGMKTFIAYGIALTAGLLLLGSAVGFLVMGFGALLAAEWAVILPVAAIVVGITALIAVFILLWNKCAGFRDAMTNIWNWVKTETLKAWGVISQFIGQKIAEIKAFWDKNGPEFMQAVTNVWNVIVAVTKAVWPIILFVIQYVWDAIKGIINGALNVIEGLIKIFSGLFTGDWKGMWDGIVQLLGGAVQLIWNFMSLSFVGGIKTLLVDLVKNGVKIILDFKTQIINGFKALWDGSKGIVNGMVDGVINFFKSMGTGAQTAWNAMRNAGQSIFSSMGGAIKGAVSGVKDFVVSIFRSLWSTVSGIWNTMKGAASSVFNGIKDAIVHPIQTAQNLIGSAISKIKSLFSGFKVKIPLPHFNFSVSHKNIAGMNVPVPDFGVNWYAKGGVFNGASIVGVGEAGPEAVVPLSGERMQPFAKAIADKMNGGSGQEITTIVQIDGREVAKATNKYMDQEMRRTRDSKTRAGGRF